MEIQSNPAISNSVNSKSPQEDRIPLDLPFPFTLPRLFRNPAISNFFPFPLGLRNSGVRLYFICFSKVQQLQLLSQSIHAQTYYTPKHTKSIMVFLEWSILHNSAPSLIIAAGRGGRGGLYSG